VTGADNGCEMGMNGGVFLEGTLLIQAIQDIQGLGWQVRGGGAALYTPPVETHGDASRTCGA
jgi:hypothetical protein